MIKPHGKVQERIYHEMTVLVIYTIILFILFSIFNIYERLLLNNFSDNQIRYGYSLFEAIIFAKIILIGQAIHLGTKFQRQPLIIHVIYKTIVFSILLLVFSLLEHFILGYFAGHTLVQTYEIIINEKLNIILAKDFIMLVIFMQFFLVQELSRAMGEHKLYELFFKKMRLEENKL